jgi:multidrug transporter EmrE-like cation transporter
MNWWALIILALGGIILTAGDLFMKKWVISNHLGLYVTGMIIYIVGLNFLAFSFKYKNIAVASVIFVLFNIITLILFSYFYFGEKLSTLEIIGLSMGIFSIILLELAEV